MSDIESNPFIPKRIINNHVIHSETAMTVIFFDPAVIDVSKLSSAMNLKSFSVCRQTSPS